MSLTKKSHNLFSAYFCLLILSELTKMNAENLTSKNFDAPTSSPTFFPTEKEDECPPGKFLSCDEEFSAIANEMKTKMCYCVEVDDPTPYAWGAVLEIVVCLCIYILQITDLKTDKSWKKYGAIGGGLLTGGMVGSLVYPVLYRTFKNSNEVIDSCADSPHSDCELNIASLQALLTIIVVVAAATFTGTGLTHSIINHFAPAEILNQHEEYRLLETSRSSSADTSVQSYKHENQLYKNMTELERTTTDALSLL